MVGATLGRGLLMPHLTEVKNERVQNRNQRPQGSRIPATADTERSPSGASVAGVTPVRQAPLEGAAAPTRRCGSPHSTVRRHAAATKRAYDRSHGEPPRLRALR